MSILQQITIQSKRVLERNAAKQSEMLKIKYAELRELGLSAAQAGIGSKLGAKKYLQLMDELRGFGNQS